MTANREQVALGHAGDLVAEDRDSSGVGLEQAQRKLQDGALARSSYAEQGLGLSDRQPKGNAAENFVLLKRHVDVLEQDGVASCGLGGDAWLCGLCRSGHRVTCTTTR